MDEKTARKYIELGKIPSEVKKEHDWRTREDPFKDVWPDIQLKLEINPNLEAKTLFEYTQRESPGSFADGQLRQGHEIRFATVNLGANASEIRRQKHE
jgi:hypothetical protein